MRAATQRRHIAMSAGLLALGLALGLLAATPASAGLTFTATDGQAVHAELSPAPGSTPAIALLFHQAGANRHEYDAVSPRLNRLGFDTLAVDQRSGGRRFGHANATVAARGGSSGYLAAYPDLEGALRWASARGYHTIVAVGSSYSASLVLQLAARHADALTAVAAFSPGEYFDDGDRVKNAVADIDIPIYITTDPAEEQRVDAVLERVGPDDVTRYKPVHGIHGASTLDADRDPAGYRANWRDFRSFMVGFAPDDR